MERPAGRFLNRCNPSGGHGFDSDPAQEDFCTRWKPDRETRMDFLNCQPSEEETEWSTITVSNIKSKRFGEMERRN